jgi:glucose dehydrogenase
VGDTLYGCTNNNLIYALDAENGRERWRFDPQADLSGILSRKCRSVSYYEASEPIGQCQGRIIAATVDARLFAIDAKTGELCTSFGENGFVNLLTDLGPVKKGFVLSTSGPAITNGVAVIGGWISDGQEIGEPSGVAILNLGGGAVPDELVAQIAQISISVEGNCCAMTLDPPAGC